MNTLISPSIRFEASRLEGAQIDRLTRTAADLKGIFNNKQAFSAVPEDTVMYEVESYFPVEEGTEGGLFLGITYIHPGTVGDEYFMTKGHFHQIRNRGEIYCGIAGEGALLLMDTNGKTWAEKIYPGSLHYIPGNTAHRTANTGQSILSFGAFWPADAGHDYDTILEKGFTKILVNQNGQPQLVDPR